MAKINEKRAYVGRCKCGAIVAVTVIEEKYRNDTANVIHNWIRNGLEIEQVSVEEARNMFSLCTCEGE